MNRFAAMEAMDCLDAYYKVGNRLTRKVCGIYHHRIRAPLLIQ